MRFVSSPARSKQFRLAATAVLIVLGVIISTPSPASAHTEFSSSTPQDGQVLDEPVSEIALTFAGEAEPAGDGFVVLDASGAIRLPDEIFSDDNLTWSISFDEPLTAGTIGVRWRVAAPDAHPIDGGFSFTVTGGASTTTPDALADPTTDLPVTNDETSLTAAQDPFEDDSANLAVPESTDEATDSESAGVAMDDFLDPGDSEASLVSIVSLGGRLSSLFGAMIGLGGLIFAAIVLRGEPSDIKSVLFWTRRAAVLLGTGALIEGIAQIASTSGTWSALADPTAIVDVLASSFGIAITLRFIGAIVLGGGARLDTRQVTGIADPVVTIREYATSAIPRSVIGAPPLEPVTSTKTDELGHESDHAWHTRTGLPAFIGAGFVLLSFLFDGHTTSEGPRILHAFANVVHVSAGAVWGGGVLMLAYVVARRHRRGAELRALQLAVRFSVVAAIALSLAGAAGVVLSFVILDSVSELWSTPWGRILVGKVILVAAAASAGAFNHKVLIPLMERNPDNKYAAQQFRTAVTAEAAILMLAIALTALLVGAAS